MSRRKRRNPLQVAEEYISGQKDPPCFLVKETEDKGRGVFTTVNMSKGEFLVEYAGELLPACEGERREKETPSVFRYFFEDGGNHYCIDATSEPVGDKSQLGRLVNHGDKFQCNSKMKVVHHEDTPHLCLFALKDIPAGREVLYNYGIKNLPWIIKPSKETPTPEDVNQSSVSSHPSKETPTPDDVNQSSVPSHLCSLDDQAQTILLGIIEGGCLEDSQSTAVSSKYDDLPTVVVPGACDPSTSTFLLASREEEAMDICDAKSCPETTSEDENDHAFSCGESSDAESLDLDISVKKKRNQKKLPLGENTQPSNSKSEDTTFVASSRSTGGHRTWDKYSYCLFCGEKQTKLVRHLRRQHKDELLVAEATAADDSGGKSRGNHIWTKIKNLGNHHHNKEVHKGNARDLIVRKRPKHGKENDVDKYVPCTDCLGYYYVKTLWVHKKTCSARKLSNNKDSHHVKGGRKIILQRHEVSVELRKVLDQLISDPISLIAKSDEDILSVGQNQLEKSNSFQKENMSREKMRTLAKILKTAREMDTNIKKAADLIRPTVFDVVIDATRCVTGYNPKTQVHQSYSKALKIGFALKDLAENIRSKYLKAEREDKVSEVDNFLKLRESEWNVKVTASALRQRNDRNWRKPQLLPLTEDCIKFNKFLVKKENDIKSAIKVEGMTDENHKSLAKVTLAQLILFNRRRPTEVELLLVEDFLTQIKEKRPVQDEVAKALTISEKVAMDRLHMVMVRGKRGRGVPILLTSNTKESLEMLISHHDSRDGPNSEYVFSQPTESSTTPFRGYDALKELAGQAELKHPENMQSTKLHKHIATLSQLLGLKDSELEQLANHVGHNIHIHREYYRLPQETVLLAKMSKLLKLTESGQIHQHCGKSLEDIHLTMEDKVDSEEESEETEEESEEETKEETKEETEGETEGETEEETKEETEGETEEETKEETEEETEGETEEETKEETKEETEGETDGETEEESDSGEKSYLDSDDEDEPPPPKKGLNTKNRKPYNRWRKDQEEFLFSQPEVKKLLKRKAAPGKLIGELMKKRSKKLLEDRTWRDIKNKIHNINMKEKMQLQKKESQKCVRER